MYRPQMTVRLSIRIERGHASPTNMNLAVIARHVHATTVFLDWRLAFRTWFPDVRVFLIPLLQKIVVAFHSRIRLARFSSVKFYAAFGTHSFAAGIAVE